MQSIYFGSDPHGRQRFLDVIHVAAAVLAAVFVLLSLVNSGEPMRYFPLLFLDAAALNFVNAYCCFRTGDGRTRRIGAGLVQIFLGLLMLMLTYVSGTCIWG